MTQMLEQAFRKASELQDQEQDQFAEFILEELKSDANWSYLYEQSQDVLKNMGHQAVEEFKSGQTAEVNTDRDFS